MEQNDEIMEITLIGEDGVPVIFEHILTFMYEDERYMALAPADLIDEEEEEIVFMHIVKAGGEDSLEPVENEVLLDELFEVFCELMDEEADEPENEEE
ncbi:MAG: DUF1292 domain-containing protein [Clostridia bacterium]|jgi:uncharacterized protein YrzB (UPF0473 family)|nr:DUF1292 domain-containing protein [Clostridia bacterium]